MNSTIKFSEDKIVEVTEKLHFYKLFYCDNEEEHIEELVEIIDILEKELYQRQVICDSHTVTIGDLVEIKNNYKGLKGRQGIVEKITKARIFLCDFSGNCHSRAKGNTIKIFDN